MVKKKKKKFWLSLCTRQRPVCGAVPLVNAGGAVEQGPQPGGDPQPQQPPSVTRHRAGRRVAAGSRALNFGHTGHIWTGALRCCRYREDPLPLLLHFYFIPFFWRQLWCSPSTWTPVMSSGRTESRAACSGSPWPCTGSSTRIKDCERSL